jgi:hypothetical protein
MGCYWENIIGEHNENFEEHVENPIGMLMRTHWELQKSKKSNTLHPILSPRKKNWAPWGP